MKRENKKLILVFFLAILIIANFVSAIEITSCIPNNLKLDSGINQPVTFQVKADTGGYFSGGIECNQGVSATFPGFQLESYEIKTIKTQLILNNPNKDSLYYNCILTIRRDNYEKDTCEFGGIIEYNSGIVGGCQDDSDCSSGQQCKFGNCVEKDEEINTNNTPIISSLIIALGIIVGLVILGLLIKKRNK